MPLFTRFLGAQLYLVEVLSAPAFLSPVLIVFVRPFTGSGIRGVSEEHLTTESWHTPPEVWLLLMACCLVATLRWMSLIFSPDFNVQQKQRALAYNMAGWFLLGSSLGLRAWLA